MKTLRSGSSGSDVKRWQLFLIGQGYELGTADGKFGPRTEQATIAFQTKQKLTADGVVGNNTVAKAMLLGFEVVASDLPADNTLSPAWPPKPDFSPLVSTADRQRIFGKFTYTHRPIPGNPENIDINPMWSRHNIVRIEVPQLVGIKGAPKNGRIYVHKLVADQIVALWDAWEKADLLHLVLTWGGSYVPRLVRGGRSLSNHAFGTAFDINVAWNRLGTRPALIGQHGSVRSLVPIAHEHGLYWGGHFSRPDGMHFEVARVR